MTGLSTPLRHDVFCAGNAGKDYKAKYRSLVFNLRDPNNPDLRARVLGGEISPDKLVQLSAAELASKVTFSGSRFTRHADQILEAPKTVHDDLHVLFLASNGPYYRFGV